MKKIPLTQGKYAFVDDDDYNNLSGYKWYYNKGYAVRGSSPKILMHRIINKTPKGMDTDHINRNTLDNRKQNLRGCTRSQNCTNRPAQKHGSSGFKGVSWHKHRKAWSAYVCVNKKMIYLGYFENKEDAAKAHDKKAKEIYGDFAYLNFAGGVSSR